MGTYIIQSTLGGPVKIGQAHDICGRLIGLQTGTPFSLRLIAEHEDARYEARLHDRFRACRYRGEWYSLSVDFVKWYRENPDRFGQYFPLLLSSRFDEVSDGIGRLVRDDAFSPIRRLICGRPINGWFSLWCDTCGAGLSFKVVDLRDFEIQECLTCGECNWRAAWTDPDGKQYEYRGVREQEWQKALSA